MPLSHHAHPSLLSPAGGGGHAPRNTVMGLSLKSTYWNDFSSLAQCQTCWKSDEFISSIPEMLQRGREGGGWGTDRQRKRDGQSERRESISTYNSLCPSSLECVHVCECLCECACVWPAGPCWYSILPRVTLQLCENVPGLNVYVWEAPGERHTFVKFINVSYFWHPQNVLFFTPSYWESRLELGSVDPSSY